MWGGALSHSFACLKNVSNFALREWFLARNSFVFLLVPEFSAAGANFAAALVLVTKIPASGGNTAWELVFVSEFPPSAQILPWT